MILIWGKVVELHLHSALVISSIFNFNVENQTCTVQDVNGMEKKKFLHSNQRSGHDWQTKTIKQEEVQSGIRSQFLRYEIDFEVLIKVSFNEWDQDFFNLS